MGKFQSQRKDHQPNVGGHRIQSEQTIHYQELQFFPNSNLLFFETYLHFTFFSTNIDQLKQYFLH